MALLTWDNIGERFFETGVDQGVLYIPDSNGAYIDGVAWNGLTNVTESPSGAEPNAQYADNTKYLNLFSAEEFAATLEAFTYPDEFQQFDGLAVPTPGVAVGQQTRKTFGLSYRTKIGNDLDGDDYAYKRHLIYGCQASPSEKAYGTTNDSPEPITFSWSIATNPVPVTGMKSTSILTIDSRYVGAPELLALENLLHGSAGDPFLPMPDTVISMFTAGVTTVTPTMPSYNSGTDTLTIPTVTGVEYYINDVLVAAGDIVLTADTLVEARPASGYVFTAGVDTDWFYDYIP
jgi:hypothetical protein